MKRAIGLTFAILLTTAASAEQSSPPTSLALSVDSIMRGPELVGYPPSALRWSGDSKELYFEWRMPKEDEPVTWVVGREGGQPRRLTEAERRQAPLAIGVWDAGRRRILGIDRGDVVIVDTVARTRLDVTRTTGAESNARWTPDGSRVTFVRDNNLFVVPVQAATSGLRQLTDVTAATSEPRRADSQRFVKKEEQSLVDWVQQETARRKRREARERERSLPRFELAERQFIADAALSADDAFAYLLVGERPQARTAQVPRYVSESAYTEEISARSKVGDAQERRRLVVLDLATREAVWVGLDGVADPVRIPVPELEDEEGGGQGERDKPAEPTAKRLEASSKREARWGALLPSPDGRQLVTTVRAADNTDRWIVLVDPTTGRTKVLDHVRDEAWVREIGPATNVSGGVGWLPDNRRVWFLAERDGWMHLYTVDVAAERPEAMQLTTGRFEIDTVQLSPDGRTFYFQSNEQHPGERHLYAIAVEGGPRTRISSTVGGWEGTISPDNAVFGAVFSASNKPPEVYLLPNQPGAAPAQVTTSVSPEWRTYRWVEPQLVTYRARDGAEVYARLYTPEMVGARRHPSAPAVVFVHGAGYLQNAHRYWSNYYREYMFHHLLASRGYVVLDPDYRASAGYGRDWRTAIYRWMGGKDLDDVVDGAAYLAKAHKVDARRIGVYGGSYGGFITLMAMFTSPETFAAGAALRPVTDWAHYNHPYTSNILNEPQTDSESYRKSSPIYFADRLKGALLICHGMVDVNVHFQDSVRLAQRLIELRKENWELAVYPVEDHGFVEATSWADEYKRILKLFEENLK
jgi:dipeptidyl aminopeptidase/acylaminoacyl peptidase